MALRTPSKSFDVASGGSDTLYFRGHPRYDAVRVEFDSADSGSADTDVTYYVDTNDEVDDVESNGTGAMTQVDSTTTLDPSSGATDGTERVARVVAVEINEQGGTSNAAGTVKLHSADDPAESAAAFANR